MWSHDKRECVQSGDNRSPRAIASEVTLTGHEEADVTSKKGTLSSLWNTCVQSDNDCWTHSGHLKEEMHHATVRQSLMAAALTSTWQVPCDLFFFPPTCLLCGVLLSSHRHKKMPEDVNVFQERMQASAAVAVHAFFKKKNKQVNYY